MREWPPDRRASAHLRHGNLPEALVDAALSRLEADGVRSISLRDLASDAGVNHRAVYRHFPTSCRCWRVSPSKAGSSSASA
jgi:AcrR family transcriptional regulator